MRICFLWALSVVTAASSAGESLDQRLYERIHEDWKSPAMDWLMKSISEAGDRETCLVLCLGLSAFGSEKGRDVGKLSFASLLGGQAVCTVLKFAVNRERPEGESGRGDSSFPSGHAAGAFSIAYVIGNEYPGLKVPSFILAGLISLSRVYLGRHYPSDVLAGALLGSSAGYLVMRKREAIINFHL